MPGQGAGAPVKCRCGAIRRPSKGRNAPGAPMGQGRPWQRSGGARCGARRQGLQSAGKGRPRLSCPRRLCAPAPRPEGLSRLFSITYRCGKLFCLSALKILAFPGLRRHFYRSGKRAARLPGRLRRPHRPAKGGSDTRGQLNPSIAIIQPCRPLGHGAIAIGIMQTAAYKREPSSEFHSLRGQPYTTTRGSKVSGRDCLRLSGKGRGAKRNARPVLPMGFYPAIAAATRFGQASAPATAPSAAQLASQSQSRPAPPVTIWQNLIFAGIS